jgi:cyclic lactone autoinducer peptide
MSKIIKKLMSVVPAMALLLAVGSAAAPCYCFYRQPDLPDALKKYDE